MFPPAAPSASRSSRSLVGALLPGVAQAQSEEPECPTISLDDVSVLTAPCADASRACDLDVGCMGAVIDYVGTRIDLSQFSQGPPSQEYIASCVAPFALSPEVTETVPQETLGAMINVRLRRRRGEIRRGVRTGAIRGVSNRRETIKLDRGEVVSDAQRGDGVLLFVSGAGGWCYRSTRIPARSSLSTCALTPSWECPY